MLTIDRVLYPTDLTPGAARAFPQAAALAEWHDAELHILNVAGRHDHRYEEMKAHFPLETTRLQAMLTDEDASPDGGTPEAGEAGAQDSGATGDPPARLPDLASLTIVQEQVEGAAPADQIVAYADDADIDLIVMGTHGRRGVERLMIGSVAEDVVRTAPCPVFTIRNESEVAPGRAVHRILVPIDFSDASDAAIAHARELALTYGAQIDLLHVVEEVIYPSSYGVEPASIPTAEVVDRVEEALAGLAREEIGYEHVTVKAVPGYAPTEILDYADDHDVDLIVIATHGRSGLDRMLLGSVTERIVRRAPGPVFVAKPKGKSLVDAERAPTGTAST